LNIFEEYIEQQKWRNWSQYIQEIPISKNDKVIDLGCSVGVMSDLFSKDVHSITGIDSNIEFVNYCLSKLKPNQNFICQDFTQVNYASFASTTGVWSSFSLSYLKNPKEFLKSIYQILEPQGWIALVDVSNFISGNMLPECKHLKLVRDFENESIISGSYDFTFGSKMERFLHEVGFKITHINNNISDQELNFEGAASPKILEIWRARLERMQGLRNKFPIIYSEIVNEVLFSLGSENRSKNNNVRFVVAKKI
jgi:ubiquinone/menaquinone biosynthesis C-methylase UbiE